MKTENDLAEYSPDGIMLTVGSHDNNIYFYSSDDYSKLGYAKSHNSFIVSVDWSADSSQELLKSRIGNLNGVICVASYVLFFYLPVI